MAGVKTQVNILLKSCIANILYHRRNHLMSLCTLTLRIDSGKIYESTPFSFSNSIPLSIKYENDSQDFIEYQSYVLSIFAHRGGFVATKSK